MRRAGAFLLTLLAAGTGHLALGRGRRAMAWIAGLQGMLVIWVGLLVIAPGAGVLWLPAMGLAVFALLADVVIITPGARVPRWFIVAGAAVLLIAVVNFEAKILRTYVMRAYTAASKAMSPALEHGDYFLVDKVTYRRGDPRRGDIVVFDYPRDPRRTFVMRVVGLPGERLLLRGRDVVINGAVIPEPYLAIAMNDVSACGYQYGCSETLVPARPALLAGASDRPHAHRELISSPSPRDPAPIRGARSRPRRA